jgi:hypothetical protein
MTVRRVPVAHVPLSSAEPADDEAARPGDVDQRLDFQDTLPLVFHLGSDAQATEA